MSPPARASTSSPAAIFPRNGGRCSIARAQRADRAIARQPQLQSALATLRGAARQAVYAQEGKYFPRAGQFQSIARGPAASLSPATASGADIYNLRTRVPAGLLRLRCPGLNRRAVVLLQALADVQRFEVEVAYLALTSNVVVAAITEASLRGQIEATDRLIAINGKMLDIFQRRLDTGYGNANSDVAVQAAALAQGQGDATAGARRWRSNATSWRRCPAPMRAKDRAAPLRQPALAERCTACRLANGAAPGRARRGGTNARRQRPDRRRHRQPRRRTSPSAPTAAIPTCLCRVDPAVGSLELAGNATQTIFDAAPCCISVGAGRAHSESRAIAARAPRGASDALRALQNDADELRAARDFERAAKKSFDLAQQQLDKGQGNVLLLTAEQTYLQASIQVVHRRKRRDGEHRGLYSKRSAAAVELNRAAGGKDSPRRHGPNRTDFRRRAKMILPCRRHRRPQRPIMRLADRRRLPAAAGRGTAPFRSRRDAAMVVNASEISATSFCHLMNCRSDAVRGEMVRAAPLAAASKPAKRLPWLTTSSSNGSARNIVAHPSGSLRLRAKRAADCL